MESIKVFIVEVLQEYRTNIIDILSNVEYIKIIGESDCIEETFSKLQERDVDVILVGANVSNSGYKIAEKITSEYPEASVVIVEESLKKDIVYKALNSGAKDVLIYPFTAVQLVDTIYRVNELSKKKAIHNRENYGKTKKQRCLGSVLTFFSTKGGVGKTFIATNLAVAIQKESRKSVVLVDLDLDFGNVATVLNVEPKFTISDLIDDIGSIDKELIESYLIKHESGIRILPANSKPQISEFIDAEHVQIILKTLQKFFDYIIVDMPARFYEPVNPAFAISDNLFIVTTPEISTIRNVKSALNILKNLNYPKSKVKIILNRYDSKGVIKTKDVEVTLNQNIYGNINFDYRTVITSLNEGVPIIIKNSKNGVGKELVNIAKKIIKD